MVKLEIPSLIGSQVTRRMDVYHAGFCLIASPTPGSTALLNIYIRNNNIHVYRYVCQKFKNASISFYPLNLGKTKLVLFIRLNK